MDYLLDTNVLSELRRGAKCDPKVRAWASSVKNEASYISVLSLGEIRKGIDILRRKSPEQVVAFEKWLKRLEEDQAEFILPIDEAVAECWGYLNAERSYPTIDGLLAATALHFQLSLATRNVKDCPPSMRLVNPWDFAG
jgi:toxin FitB